MVHKTGEGQWSTTRSYSYQTGTNRVSSITNPSNSLSYDLNGNIANPGTSDIGTIAYDPFTQLTSQIGTPSSGTEKFEYGGSKQRVLKLLTYGGVTTKTLYLHGLSDYPLTEKVVSGGGATTTKNYIYGPNGLISIVQSSSVYYAMKDHVGSTTVVFNDAGPMEWNKYLAFGRVAQSQVNPDVHYRFTGQEQDKELAQSLHNFRARFYDSELGRFYAPDPAGEGFSPYAYVGNRPLTNVDPTGMMTPAGWLAKQQAEAAGLEGAPIGMHVGNAFGDLDGWTSISADDVSQSEWRASLYNYAEYMNSKAEGWGLPSFHYGSDDEAARAAYYQIARGLTSEMFAQREYGAIIYKEKDGSYTFSSKAVVGDGTSIDYEDYRSIAESDRGKLVTTSVEVHPGEWKSFSILGAALVHTHTTNHGDFSTWDQQSAGGGSDTWTAYWLTTNRTIYLLKPNGEALKWRWDEDIYNRSKLPGGGGFYEAEREMARHFNLTPRN